MTLLTLTLLVLAILFISTLTRSTFGFGDALIAMPLLTWVIGIQKATPLVAFAASTIAFIILVKNWQAVDFKIAWRLIASSLLGIPIGIFLLKSAPERLVQVLLGTSLALFGLYNLASLRIPRLEGEKSAYSFGFVAGILGGAVGATRPAIDEGWAEEWQMIGQSGKTVRPTLYIGMGISGVMHHVVGMDQSKTIVSINTDPKADITELSDVIVVEDFRKIVPKLIAEIQARQKACT